MSMVTISKARFNILKRDAAAYRRMIIAADEDATTETVVFDAIRDNDGKGIKASELLKSLGALRLRRKRNG